MRSPTPEKRWQFNVAAHYIHDDFAVAIMKNRNVVKSCGLIAGTNLAYCPALELAVPVPLISVPVLVFRGT